MRKFLCKLIIALSTRGLLNWVPDKIYLNVIFYLKFGKKINFDNPKTYNEKLQYLKIYNRKSEYTQMVDKYEVRNYVKEKLGEELLIPLLWDGENPKNIPFNELPEKFVIKCNHGSHSNIICNDKNNINKKATIEQLKKWLKRNWYWYGREWPYKNVKPRIIIEKYVKDNKSDDLKDYKFFCFNGKVKFFKVDFDRFDNHRANYYDCENNLLKFGEISFPPDFTKKIDIPSNIKEMIKYAEILSECIPFVRVDFYNVNGKIYFGEMTFFPAAGFGIIEPKEWDNKIGDMLNIIK